MGIEERNGSAGKSSFRKVIFHIIKTSQFYISFVFLLLPGGSGGVQRKKEFFFKKKEKEKPTKNKKGRPRPLFKKLNKFKIQKKKNRIKKKKKNFFSKGESHKDPPAVVSYIGFLG